MDALSTKIGLERAASQVGTAPTWDQIDWEGELLPRYAAVAMCHVTKSTVLVAIGNDEQKDAVLQALDDAFCHWGCGAYVVDRPARRIGRVLGPMPTEADRHAILSVAGRALGKKNDPRYVPGVSEHDDDMTDEEWFWAMGPIPQEGL